MHAYLLIATCPARKKILLLLEQLVILVEKCNLGVFTLVPAGLSLPEKKVHCFTSNSVQAGYLLFWVIVYFCFSKGDLMVAVSCVSSSFDHVFTLGRKAGPWQTSERSLTFTVSLQLKARAYKPLLVRTPFVFGF
jgi:hypothetical protein